MYTVLFIAAVLVGLTILFVRSKHERRKQQDVVESYVADIFASQTYRPEVSAGFTYGIPSYTLKFKSDKEKEHAINNGLTGQFVNKIQKLCGDLRPRGEAFDAERAVVIYSLEDEKRWAQEAAAYRNGEGK